jgi:hypothetical protein
MVILTEPVPGHNTEQLRVAERFPTTETNVELILSGTYIRNCQLRVYDSFFLFFIPAIETLGGYCQAVPHPKRVQ